MSTDTRIEQSRCFLKDTIRKQIDFSLTDQSRGVPAPPMEKECPADAERIDLVPPDQFRAIEPVTLLEAIRRRRSHRRFRDEPLSLEELSFLLWATQGVRDPSGRKPMLRTAPSAGARHAFETYACVRRVSGLKQGIYRYLPLRHQAAFLFGDEALPEHITAGCFGQSFAGEAAVVLVWTALPYRMEWRYGLASYKVMAVDAGHVCQNLYLACEAIHAGTCAIGAYDQERMDALLRVDGQDEFTVYIAPVGKV